VGATEGFRCFAWPKPMPPPSRGNSIVLLQAVAFW
jgi:hypothetical protein